MKIEIPTLASLDDAVYFRLQVDRQNISFGLMKSLEDRPTSNYVFMRNASRAICGGAFVQFTFDLLVVDTIWIAEEVRRQGNGTRLYRAIEDLAFIKGKTKVSLSTYEAQGALPFWKKIGFQEFGRIPGGSAGSPLVYLWKAIEAENRN